MPAPPEILAALAGLAQRWQELATASHAYIVALGLAAGFGWRPAWQIVWSQASGQIKPPRP